jgi:hypothetical protein
MKLAIQFESGAAWENGFGSALANHPIFSIRGADDHRHHASLKIERHFIDFAVLWNL